MNIMLCFSDFSCSADIRLLKLLQSFSLTLANYLQEHHQSGHVCAWQAFHGVYFSAGQGEIDSSSSFALCRNLLALEHSLWGCMWLEWLLWKFPLFAEVILAIYEFGSYGKCGLS